MLHRAFFYFFAPFLYLEFFVNTRPRRIKFTLKRCVRYPNWVLEKIMVYLLSKKLLRKTFLQLLCCNILLVTCIYLKVFLLLFWEPIEHNFSRTHVGNHQFIIHSASFDANIMSQLSRVLS